MKLLPNIEKREGGHEAIYNAALQPLPPASGLVIRRKWLVAGSVVGAFVAVLGMGVVKKQFFPTSDRPEVLVEVQMPYGTSIEQTSATTAKVEAWLAKQPEAKTLPRMSVKGRRASTSRCHRSCPIPRSRKSSY